MNEKKGDETRMNNLFSSKLQVINLGIEQFSNDIKKQGADAIQLD